MLFLGTAKVLEPRRGAGAGIELDEEPVPDTSGFVLRPIGVGDAPLDAPLFSRWSRAWSAAASLKRLSSSSSKSSMLSSIVVELEGCGGGEVRVAGVAKGDCGNPGKSTPGQDG